MSKKRKAREAQIRVLPASLHSPHSKKFFLDPELHRFYRLQGNQDVRTLLLCKINPYKARHQQAIYPKAYSDTYLGPDKNGRKYLTFGNFDAITIYRPRNTSHADWLKHIEEDRKEISKHLTSETCYHPIYMISNDIEKQGCFWKRTKDFPACVITLVYGVDSGNDPADAYISKFLNHLMLHDAKSAQTEFTVYQAVNICDAVVLWMTDDISTVLELSAKIGREGRVRKTYSIVGLNLSDWDDYDKSKTHLQNSLCDNTQYHLRVHGSIRDHKLSTALFTNGSEGLFPVDNISTVNVFGNDDFDITLKNLSKEKLLDCIFNMMNNSSKISKACWEVHTEFVLTETYTPVEKSLPDIAHPLDKCFNDFTNIYEEMLKNSVYCPWAPAFLELLSTHVNIDHHPILHTPTQMYLDFVDIANSYFRGSVAGPEQSEYQEILKKSSEGIFRVIRNWSHLTNRLIRTDDLIFHGVGSIPSIHETLPESILRFYHAFLRDIVIYLIRVDTRRDLRDKKKVYQQDFLLVPEYNQRLRISKMFTLSEYHNQILAKPCNKEASYPFTTTSASAVCDENCKKTCSRRFAWPDKQVYLVEVQTSLLYDPPAFLFPLVHECFHFFGDAFRQRAYRTIVLGRIIATEIQYAMNMEEKWNQDFKNLLLSNLQIQKPIGLNLSRTADCYYKLLNDLFTVKKLEEIQDQLDIAQGNEFRQKWLSLSRTHTEDLVPDRWKLILEKWMWYFKECFADLMALLLFEFDIKYYFQAADEEWRAQGLSEEKVDQESWKFVQRIAVVLTAYKLDSKKDYDEASLGNEPLFHFLDNWDTDGFIFHHKMDIKNTILALMANGDRHGSKQFIDRPPILAHLLDYLFRVKSAFLNISSDERDNPDSRFSILRRNHRQFFVEGRMFTPAFTEYLASKSNPYHVKPILLS